MTVRTGTGHLLKLNDEVFFVDIHSDCRAVLEALKLRRRWSERFVAQIMELAEPLDSVNFQQVSRKEVREADWMCRVRARAG
mgnify:FL=1